MDKWNILKNYIDKLCEGNPYDTGHDSKRAFRQIQTLMSLIDNDDYQDVVVDNLILRFKDIHNRSIIFGREDNY